MPPSMDGWLNRHVPGTREGHNWRLVRGTINGDMFVMRGAPQSLRAFDPSLARPALSPADQELVEQLIAEPRLLPFCVDLVSAFDVIKKHPPAVIASCIRSCLLPGLLLNDAVNAGLQQLADTVSRSDDELSNSLKREVYGAYAAATDLIPHPSAPEPVGMVDVRLWQLARVAHQLWLPPDLFADPQFVETMGRQVHYFHLAFWNRWSPITDPSVLFHFEGASAAWNLNPLTFDLKTPHFLGSLLLGHAFATTISEQTRGEMLTSWINLGVKLRQMGDIVGWIAIAAVICTPSVLRLRNAWSYVPQQLRETVSREWGFEVFELEKRAVIELLEKSTFRASTEEMGEEYHKSACVPYFGDVITTSKPTPDHASQQLDRLAAVNEGWLYYFDNAPDLEGPVPHESVEPHPYFQDLFASWLRLNGQLPNPLLSAPHQSFQIEPRAFGYYLPYFFTQSQPLSVGSFIPLLFTEPIPSFRLLSKNALAAAASASRQQRGPIGNISQPRTPNMLHRSNSFPPLTTGVREIENGPREYLSKHGSPHVIVKSIRDLLNIGVKTHLVGMDLVLKSTDDQNPSRHSSILEERTSTIDKRSSVQSLELVAHLANMDIGSIEVVVKAASLQRLVDTLVLGVGEFSTSKHRFKINLPSHTETFMATFRSFCSPTELLKMLETRFFGASEAAFSIVAQRSGQPISQRFPNWGHTSQPVTGQALRVMSQIYCNILEAIQFWITEFHVDFADDAELTQQMRKFLLAIEGHLGAFESLPNHARRLSDTFVKLRYRAPDIVPVEATPKISRHVVHLAPEPSLGTLEQYIEELDAIVADHFNAISTVDWMQLFETLELQIADPMSLFNYSPAATTSEEELPIQDIFSYFNTLFRGNSKDKTASYFPATVKALLKLHTNITDYFAYQITDPMLHVLNRNRVSRFADILKMIGILRVRMKFFDLFPNTSDDLSTRVPSFIESAIVAAILKPESRAYASAWLQAGLDVQSQYDPANETPMSIGSFSNNSNAAPQCAIPNSFTIFIPRIDSEMLSNGKRDSIKPITPCIGWIVERLFEIVCYVPNMAIENSELINFDKRRYAYNLVRNIRNEFQKSAVDPKLYVQFDYIVNPDVSLYKLDKRAIKESVARETQGMPKWKQKQRAFTGCVSAELEKMRLEAKQYDLLVSRTPSITSSSSLTSVSLLEKRIPRMRPISSLVNSPPMSSGSSLHQPGNSEARTPVKNSSRSRFGSLLKSTVRPLSMAFSSSNISALSSNGSVASTPTGSVVNPSNLPDLESSDDKIIGSLDLSTCEIRGPRKGVFRIVPSKGTECVLQAPNEADGIKWVEALVDACKAAVAAAQMKPGSTKVFGVPIEIVCKREGSSLPNVISMLLERVEEFGLDEVGLYRISGSLASVNNLKAALDNGEKLKSTDSRWIDMNVVAGCVKLYLRELPEPLLSPIFEEFVECANCPREKQLKLLFDCIHRLPEYNYNLLRRIVLHLNLVVQHESTNKMSTPNLAIVFSMNFFSPNAMDRMRPMQSIVNTMIVNQNYLFADSNASF